MEYRQNDWSILGFGCMRFPKKGGSVDVKETERELAYAIAHGVNYFDTAYIYSGKRFSCSQKSFSNSSIE